MTETIQPRSLGTLSETENGTEKNEPQTEDNRSTLLSIIDDLNKLSETVNKLDHLLERRKIEQMLYQEKKQEGKNEN